MDELIHIDRRHADSHWIQYIDAEHGLVTTLAISNRSQARQTFHENQIHLTQSFLEDDIDQKNFKALLDKARETFTPSKQLTYKIHFLDISQAKKQAAFEYYTDHITHDFISIPILCTFEFSNKKHTQWWDLTAYLSFLLMQNIEPEDLQDNDKWQTIKAYASQKVHRLQHPLTGLPIHYQTLKIPTDDDLREFEKLIAEYTSSPIFLASNNQSEQDEVLINPRSCLSNQ